IKIIKQEKLKNIRIRVVHHNDIVFQYLMDGKAGQMWLDRKENVVLEAKHSSLYVFHHQDRYQHMIDNDKYAVCGGGFPLIENNQVTGAFCISGLAHEEDHDLIIKALKLLKEEAYK
ncbi:MAG: heme-binding protein, partial [Coprobacillus sp.]